MKKIIVVIFTLVSFLSCKKTIISSTTNTILQENISYEDVNNFIPSSLNNYQTNGMLSVNKYKSANSMLQTLSSLPVQAGIIENMEYIFKNNYTDTKNLPVNNLSSEVNLITDYFIHDLFLVNNSQDIENLFQSYQGKISTANSFTRNDKIILNIYFATVKTSLNFITMNITKQFSNNRTTMDIWSIIRCAAGTVGGAVLGGIAGAGVGTVTLPIIGTVSGAAVGFWGGALVGATASCYYSKIINNEENTIPLSGLSYSH